MFLIVKNVFKGRWGNNSRLTLLVNQRIEASCVLILKPEFEKLKGCILDLDKYSLSICVFVDAKGSEYVCMRVSVCVCERERENRKFDTLCIFYCKAQKSSFLLSLF